MSQSELKAQHRQAHQAITELLEGLKGKDLNTFSRNPNIQEHLIDTAEAWRESLERAKRGLEEWCPGGGFFIDTNPRR